MSMFNPKDIETLHAYLDEELSPTEITEFEVLLNEDPALKEVLENERQFRAGFRAHIRQTHTPVSLRAGVYQLTPSPVSTPWQRFLSSWLAPKSIRPMVAVAGLFLWSVFLVGLVQQFSEPSRTQVPIQQFITKHELYFEGIPSLDMTGSQEEVNAWIERQAPFPAQAPDLGDEWRVEGARLDDFQQRRMIDILYFKDSGLDASISIFDAQNHIFPNGEKVTYNGMVYYVTDDGWHRTIVWTSNGVGYALVGNLVISSDELFGMAAVVRNQFD